MAQYQTADGRWLVGMVEGDNSYHGFLGWRDCVIQLTSSGATEQSVDYLNAFRDYALYHSTLGQPIMPPNVNVWINNNGSTSSVQADDLSVSGDTFTIGGIKWTGSAWDYTNAGQGGGGSSGGGVLVVNIDEEYSALDKTWQEIHDALAQGTPCVTLYNEDDDATQGAISSATKDGPPGSELYLIRVLVALGTDAVVERWQASSADGYPVYMSE